MKITYKRKCDNPNCRYVLYQLLEKEIITWFMNSFSENKYKQKPQGWIPTLIWIGRSSWFLGKLIFRSIIPKFCLKVAVLTYRYLDWKKQLVFRKTDFQKYHSKILPEGSCFEMLENTVENTSNCTQLW